MASLNITASFFANHVWCVAHTHTRAAACALVLIDPLHLTAAARMTTCRYYGDAHRDIFLGEERASRISPLQSAKSKGVKWGLHSDAPITESDPLKTMWTVRFATPHTTRTDATCHSMACLCHAYVMLMSCLRHAYGTPVSASCSYVRSCARRHMTSSSLNSSVCLLVCLTQVVTRRTRSGKTLGADQCVSPIEALRAYTIDNAYLGL